MRALIIGAGAAGRIHAEQLVERGHEVTIFDTDAKKAEALAYACEAAAVEDCEGEYDLSVVAVPTRYHYDYIVSELKNGRGVVAEKPLCLRADEADEVARLSRALPSELYIAESQGYGGAAKMKQAVQTGHFGNPVIWRLCTMSKWRSQPWSYELETGGGAFLEGGVHMLTVARALFGEAVGWQGSFRNFMGGTGPDNGQLIIDYERGDMVTLTIAWGTEDCFTGACPHLPNHHGIIGPKACQSWFPGDDHASMWSALLPAIEAGTQPFVTVEHAAGAVSDVWKCYEAGGVSLD